MKSTFHQVQDFLTNPSQKKDSFWGSDALIWIDWRECDEDILRYLNGQLADGEKIDFEVVPTDKERGVDIVLKKGGARFPIPYQDCCTDRDTTLKSAQDYLAPNCQIRWFLESLGCDTLAFCLMPASQLEQLERQFGPEATAYFFAPIERDSRMFDLDVGEVCDLMEAREEL